MTKFSSKLISIGVLFSLIIGFPFLFSPLSTKAAGNLIEAYYGEFADYQGVPQGKAMTAEELKVITDQDEKTSFATSLPDQAVMLFHFNVGVIDHSQTKLTFSWSGWLTSSRAKNDIQIYLFDQISQSWHDKDVVLKQIANNTLVSLAVAFDQNGNTGTNLVRNENVNLNLDNLVNSSGDVWLAVWGQYGEPTLTTTDISLQITTPSSTEPQTNINLSGTAGTAGWFISPVTVSFTSLPAVGSIIKTEYSLNSGPLQTYTGPLTLGTEGITKIQYRSYDSGGNIEGLRWNEIKIDTKPPIINVVAIILYDVNDKYQGSVSSLSSLKGATLNFATQLVVDDPFGPDTTFYYTLNRGSITPATKTGGTKSLIKIDTSGSHLLEFWAVDRAGQESSSRESVPFTLDFANYQKPIGTSGGTVNTYYGDTLTIPDSALSEDTNITTQILDSSTLPVISPTGGTVLPRAYQFGPPGTTFTTPITVIFKYTDEDLASGDPNQLGVYVWDSILNQWVFRQGKVDTVNKTLTVELDHFSLFILAIDNTPPTIEILPLAQNYLLDTTLSISTDDNLSGVVSIKATLDGTPAENPTQISLPQEGQHSLIVTAKDNIGNLATEGFSFNVYSLTWLPPLSTQDIYAFQDGSTLPLKFSILDLNGNFVADDSVKIEIYNANPQQVTGPFNIGSNPAVGIDVQKNQYHFNLQTQNENLDPGTYTLEVNFDSFYLSGSSSTSFELFEGGKAKGRE